MFNQLTALGVGVVVFALVIGVGIIVLQQFSVATAGCATSYTYNTTNQLCQSDANISVTANPSTAAQYTNTLNGYMGTSSGGLASWTPAVIALAVGLLFIGSLMVLQGRKA
jgi:hypothetical protein